MIYSSSMCEWITLRLRCTFSLLRIERWETGELFIVLSSSSASSISSGIRRSSEDGRECDEAFISIGYGPVVSLSYPKLDYGLSAGWSFVRRWVWGSEERPGWIWWTLWNVRQLDNSVSTISSHGYHQRPNIELRCPKNGLLMWFADKTESIRAKRREFLLEREIAEGTTKCPYFSIQLNKIGQLSHYYYGLPTLVGVIDDIHPICNCRK